jgi:hypothetical protein
MAIGAGGNKLGTRALTQELRKLAQQAIDVDAESGDPITRETRLATLIWNQALGWVEKKRDDEGNLKEIVHPPVAWAQQYVFERLEGKIAQAAPDEHGSIKAVDRVRELNRDRVNLLAKIAVGPPKAKVRPASIAGGESGRVG